VVEPRLEPAGARARVEFTAPKDQSRLSLTVAGLRPRRPGAASRVYVTEKDKFVSDATAIRFTCTKANNLPRKPAPFGLRFVPDVSAITVEKFDVT
jgi:hypothetical protein